MNRHSVDVLVEPFQPREQPGKPLLGLVVPHRDRERLALAYDHHQLLPPRDARVNQIPLEQQVLLRRQRDHDGGKLRPLRLVDRDRARQRDLVQLPKS